MSITFSVLLICGCASGYHFALQNYHSVILRTGENQVFLSHFQSPLIFLVRQQITISYY